MPRAITARRLPIRARRSRTSTLFPYTTLFRSPLFMFMAARLRGRNAWIDSAGAAAVTALRSEEHTSELQSLRHPVCRLLLQKKNLARLMGRPRRRPARRARLVSPDGERAAAAR